MDKQANPIDPENNTGDASGGARIRVYLADLTYYQQGRASEILPNAVGCVGTYARRIIGDSVDVRIFKLPDLFWEAVKTQPPNVVGMSNYVWNCDLSSRFAAAVKARYPATITVAGGPNYPLAEDRQIAFLRAHPEFDFYVINEGEIPFAHLLDLLRRNHFRIPGRIDIAGVHYLDRHSGEAVLPPPAERIRDLSEVPSPYLAGWLDEFFDDGFQPIIQTTRGCPYSCTFCVEGNRFYNKLSRREADRVAEELDYIGRHMGRVMANGGRSDLFIADSNFGILKGDLETAEAIRKCKKKYAWPQFVSVATAKNHKERVLEAAAILEGSLRISGSVQSLDETVLANIKRRNVDTESILQLATAGSSLNAKTYSEIIIGLPGETRETFEETVRTLINMGFTQVCIYTLILLSGSEMHDRRTRAEHGFVTRYRIIPGCFGYFNFNELDICATEIEEVVVATNTLSFQDYLECRRLSFFVELFHNDALFLPVFDLLRSLGISGFDCLDRLAQVDLPGPVATLVDDFVGETAAELWDSAEELAAFVRRLENIERFISGELGSNVTYKYKILGILTQMPALAEALAGVVKSLICERCGPINRFQDQFIDEVLLFCTARARNIFENLDEPPTIPVCYDHDAIIKSGRFLAIGAELLPETATEVAFVLDDTQKKQIRSVMSAYGNEVRTLNRVFGKTNLKNLLRRPSGWRETAETA